jgi:plastocyanin
VTGATATVDVSNNTFSPSAVAVTPGGTVTFRWTAGAANHNVIPVAPATVPNSGATLRDAPFSFDAIFPVAGTYRFYCSAHGSADAGMRGSVLVQ